MMPCPVGEIFFYTRWLPKESEGLIVITSIWRILQIEKAKQQLAQSNLAFSDMFFFSVYVKFLHGLDNHIFFPPEIKY
jgi:hypothetical protein